MAAQMPRAPTTVRQFFIQFPSDGDEVAWKDERTAGFAPHRPVVLARSPREFPPHSTGLGHAENDRAEGSVAERPPALATSPRRVGRMQTRMHHRSSAYPAAISRSTVFNANDRMEDYQEITTYHPITTRSQSRGVNAS